MIQRMGRILRRKKPGVAGRFVIMFAKDTLEDQSMSIDRDGLLDEIERIAGATGVFETDRFVGLDAFLQRPGPAVVPEPERVTVDQRWLAASAACVADDMVDD